MISQNIQISLPILKEKEVSLYIKREDLLHPFISGNKFRKLKYNLQEAKSQNKECLLTFGGAYSNHILATAAAGKEYGFKTVGVIRGEELGIDLQKTFSQNPTLKQAHQFGMEFLFVSRAAYQQKNDVTFLTLLLTKYPNTYILPEGGTNSLAIKGCEEILSEKDTEFTHVCCAMGTGGTVTGIINSSAAKQNILVFPSLKGNWIVDEINSLKPNKQNWQVIADYHFGGYGKVSEDLITFINQFKNQTNILLDPIYTGKMLFGILELIKNNHFKKGSKILAIHTGGLQGIAGMNLLLKQKNKTIINE
ncbi:1-aminocyclopropane-1-carboxylate deaminase/D-cysteine desulfhydrase [Wenyingzhuangia marina]|uniref:1-aminocyclopropane-1-carboxylate deaminase n=1 Tax=Wenyingzhuangia marina TaxID=1195760 RepID=A0A1M5SFF5_9FLAO|nr:pyridoxal-phosphate dependent enzyme [Wenyingzhuangia marina]GGF62012.1 1-aminocyclopropane-1-carboxylate deaminase [Wenyingzhuangia marina]SHH37160.1 1-aminocyclopropane-1-carboxylate deaminase [Wenyingzhuangia marina]